MKVKYNSNNSGGSWWLKDEDWIKLEAAGWEVAWGGLYFCGESDAFHPASTPKCSYDKNCHGHRKFDTAEKAREHRYVGALAKEASKDFPSIKDAIAEFEKITNQSATDEGCNCCGAPHAFEWEDKYAAGESLLEYMYERVPHSLREATEALNR